MSYYEIQELACAVLDLDYNTLCDEDREDEIEDRFFKKFGVGLEQFGYIVDALLPFTPVVGGGFSGKRYHAFVNEEAGIMIVKREVNKGGEGA